MKNYPEFYRLHGVRMVNQLTNPPLTPLEKLILPMDSVYHHVDMTDDDVGISPDEIIVQQIKSDVYTDEVDRYSEDLLKGSPIFQASVTNRLVMDYHNRFKRFKRSSTSKNSIKNPRALRVVNYGMLNKAYRYTVQRFDTGYNQWFNYHLTAMKNVAKFAEETGRHQFFMVNVPVDIPPMSVLRRAENGITQSVLEDIKTDSQMTIMDFWLWLSDNPLNSTLSNIPSKTLSKVNVIFTVGSSWTVVNLGLWEDWVRRKGKDNVAGATSADASQKRFLRFLLKLRQSVSIGSISETPNPVEPIAAAEPAKKPVGFQSPALKAMQAQLSEQVLKNSDDDSAIFGDSEAKPDEDSTDDDIDQLEELHEKEKKSTEYKPYSAYKPQELSLEESVEFYATQAAMKRSITPKELARFRKLSAKYRTTIKNPYGDGSVSDFMQIDPETLKIDETTPITDKIDGVIDQSMLSSSLQVFDSGYIRKTMRKDIVNAVMGIQKAGIIVDDYKVEKVETYLDSYEIHTVKLIPITGKPTTVRFRIPIVNEDGVFKAGGVKYRMRKQRGDLPIRKISSHEVALTSYYSKMFVNRSERMVFNYPEWLVNKLTALSMTPDSKITDIKLAAVFDMQFSCPRVYSTLAKRMSEFTLKTDGGDIHFMFDCSKIDKYFADVPYIKSFKHEVPVAKLKDSIITVNQDNEFVRHYSAMGAKRLSEKLGTIEDLVGLDKSKRPVEMVEVGIFGSDIPLAMILGHHIGLGNLIETIGAKVRRERKGTRYELSDNEFEIRFEDEVLIINRNDQVASLLFSGFNRYKNQIRQYSIYSFDKKDVYGTVLAANGLLPRHIRELDLMFKLWVDHITRDILIEMKEPTDLFQLFIRSIELLLTDQHPQSMDNAFMRDRGYERFSGMVYDQLVRATRGYHGAPVPANASVSVNPEAVWMGILQDQTVMPIEESNPIHALKERQVVVFRGSGGRSGRSMTEKERAYHKNGMGIVSEATVDNADVGTITYLTADPNYTSVRGTTRRIIDPKGKNAKMVSTSMLMSPAAEKDDPKRVNFTSVQNSRTTHGISYTPIPYRTGYERVLGHVCDDTYSKTAHLDGTVVSVKPNVISVKYADGSTVSYQIGRKFGTWSGKTQPHNLVPHVKEGQKFKKGDLLFYNSNWFEPDILNPGTPIYKAGVMGRFCLMETNDSFEDSHALHREFAASKLTTTKTSIRSITVTADQQIHNLVKVGDKVDYDSILCTIHNQTEGNRDLYDDDALATLKMLEDKTPKADAKGVVEHFEVIYTGELEDMSDSIRQIVDKSDRALYNFQKAMGKPTTDGRVDIGYRVDGRPLGENTVVIKVYITGELPMTVASKIVLANQMKSVNGRIWDDEVVSEDGKIIDGFFGYQSFANRIVLSPEEIGTTSTLLIALSEMVVDAYDS